MITFSAPVSGDVLMRPVVVEDAEALSRALLRNREYLRPWDPPRDEDYFTAAGQRTRLHDQLVQAETGRMAPWVLVSGDEIVGALALTNIVRLHLQSANLGYWVDAAMAGRGLASAATLLACRAAESELGLHRVEAGAAATNTASQRVLAKCGFERIGTATGLLFLDGAWQNHVLYQKLLNDRPPRTD
ncbi:GNAT family protein [Streptomyces sp. TLI_235]|uniref:GNAT family N-acetyltransferase n=1 Tax=Kitasatospora sp. NPDC085879 TaxID=3154769 RepID=UPI000BD439BA|nr:GNAT family protein [Streptomyces sp. TLI_235]PBC70725.1 [SSU ribosomal protein S5P]-alanine acetyltransferase [Streptomyces sp. TLI_235]